MNRPLSAALVLAVLGALSPAAARAAGVPTGPIRSTTLHTCLDPSVAPNPYDTLAGAHCTGSAAQTFQFIAISGGPAHTYELRDVASAQCIRQFRFGIQAGACVASPQSIDAWTVIPVASSPTSYTIEATPTVGDPGPAVLHVHRRGSGQPGPLFGVNISPQPNATFTLPAGL